MFLLLLFLITVSSNIANSSTLRPRIVGGELARAGQFRWAAAIYKTTAEGNFFCGGALINSQWILTAGQCVDGALVFTILLGTTKLQGDENEVRLATETYFLHPDYNPQTLEHDIGLIKFREPITFSTYVYSIFLPITGIYERSTGSAVGWGQISDSESGLANDLNWVTLTALSNEECKIFYGNQITDNMLCVTGQYNEGTCYGDIGGTFVQYVKGNHFHAGIASFVSSSGCESPFPSGYVRTWPYRAWIHNITDP